MIWLLLSLALADVVVVEDGTTAEVAGPAVWMDGPTYRQYVADSRNLPVCLETLEAAGQKVIEANGRVVEARDIAKAEFEVADEEDAVQVQTIADLGAQLDQELQRNSRLQQQRNIAWAIAGGFLAASTAATVLAISP